MSIDLYHGDCLEVMKQLPDNSIDCFICDLPYGCLTGGGGKEKKQRKENGSIDSIAGCSWDIKIPLDKLWEQIKRLSKSDHTPVIMFCTVRFGYELIKSNESWFRYDLIWSKPNGVGFLSANKQPLRSHENIYIFSKKGASYKRVDIKGDFPGTSQGKGNAGGDVYKGNKNYNGVYGEKTVTHHTRVGIRCVKSVIDCSSRRMSGKHPTEKPIELYKWLIERYCPINGTLLDPTAGSFNSCIAGYELDRNCIGIEKDDKFFKRASEKVDQL